MPDQPIIVWFRRDLRLSDHAGLASAIETGRPLALVYAHDETAAGAWAPGDASRWWLHHSLAALGRSIEVRGGKLILCRGTAADVLSQLAEETGASLVHASRRHEPWARREETAVETRLASAGAELRLFRGTLLHDPERLLTQAGTPFKVYTPFWRALSASVKPGRPLASPERIPGLARSPKSESLESWDLLPRRPNWAKGWDDIWTPGQDGARKRLSSFVSDALADYARQRDRPDRAGTSRLSPHLAFGEISPRQCWAAAEFLASRSPQSDAGCETFRKELAWREFSAHLLHHWPSLPEKPFREEFAAFSWRSNAPDLKAWQRGLTGYPIVDAGLRELWATGWMHNRVRMIVASFLIKDLRLPWQTGEAWFWDTLVDADLANNAASWQWVAGSGADAAPYFRIFNPVTQGQTFDPEGAYVRRWVPEIAKLPDKVIHSPWTAPAEALAAGGVTLGTTYPAPIVDHAEARRAALAAFAEIGKRA